MKGHHHHQLPPATRDEKVRGGATLNPSPGADERRHRQHQQQQWRHSSKQSSSQSNKQVATSGRRLLSTLSNVILYTILIVALLLQPPPLPQQQQQQPLHQTTATTSWGWWPLGGGSRLVGWVDAIAPTIDYSHNMRILKLPRSTPPGSLVYRLKGSDGDPNTQLVFGVSGIEGRALLEVVPVARCWNEADVFLRAPLEASQYNLTIFVTDGNMTTQVESTILATDAAGDEATPTDDGATSAATRPTGVPTGANLPFLQAKQVFHVPEDTLPDEPIGSVTVLESQKSDLPVRFELRGRGADRFSVKYVFGPKQGQSRAEIVLAQRMDYEKQNLFNLKVLALNAWTNTRIDTRNVATLDIVITVGDVQDTPPVFRNLPQSIRLTNTMQAGDLVLRVEAEDGDYADQRPINFALDAASPLASYFDIDKQSGELRLVKPTSELAMHAAWDSAAWSLLTIFASEQPDPSSYDHLWPPMYARAELPLMLVDMLNEAPQFIGGWQTSDARNNVKTLHGYLNEAALAAAAAPAPGLATGGEHGSEPSAAAAEQSVALVRWYTNSSETGSPLVDQLSKSLGGRPSVLDLGLGSNGTFELSLEGPDASLFQVEPGLPVSKQATFTLSVAPAANRSLFDYDHHQAAPGSAPRTFSLDIVARDFGTPQRQSSRIRCLIELLDSNDNSPQFDLDLYSFSIYENSKQGQLVGSVRARDPDSAQVNGRLRYNLLAGGGGGTDTPTSHQSHPFRLDSDTGQLTLEGPLDREKRSLYLFLVEARDAGGSGRSNFTQLIVNVLDVNDNPPVFLQSHYDAVLLADGTFHQPLMVSALDADEPGSANSQVAYEIIAGNQNEQFSIDSLSGIIYPNGAGPAGSSDGGDGGKIANVLPQIPTILKEPIVPHHTGQLPSADPHQVAGGKALLPTGGAGGHEIEETTSSSSFGRHNQTSGGGGGSRNRLTASGWIPRSVAVSDGGGGGGHPIEVASAAATTTTLAQSAPAQATLGDNTPSNTDNGNSNKKSSRLTELPMMDTEQLPALDLLLNLESTEQLGGNVLAASGSSVIAYHSAQQQHQPSARSVQQQQQQPSAQLFTINTMKLPPVTTLIVRAHDFGIPLRSSTVKVNIYNQALQTRSVSVILNGTAEQLELRREAIERAFSSMTGSRATIESIDALSESSQISVARVRLAVPQHSLVDLTDLSALMNAIDYHQHHHQHQQATQYGGDSSAGGATTLARNPQTTSTTITHYIAGDRLIPSSVSSNITSAGGGQQLGTNIFGTPGDIHSFALDNNNLERRLLIYIIIVGVCILALLVIWMIYSCSREDQVKIIEKQSGGRTATSSGSYKHRSTTTVGAANGDLSTTGTTANKQTATTYAKTTVDAAAGQSPIGNNLAKSQRQATGGAATLASAGGTMTTLTGSNEQLLHSTGGLLPITTTFKPDHYSMYNGQVWFEPSLSQSHQFGGSRQTMLLTGRRASSAPSATSLDSALHLAIGGGGGGPGWARPHPRNATGQFFPNTIGYMENLASLGLPAAGGQQLAPGEWQEAPDGGGGVKLLSRRHRKRKVVPMLVHADHPDHATLLQRGAGLQPVLAPDKPPRHHLGGALRDSGHANEAFASDLESGTTTTAATVARQRVPVAAGAGATQRRAGQRGGRAAEEESLSAGSRSGSAASSAGGATLVLDSDQELLGFDSTGTPIIATHTSVVRPPVAAADEMPRTATLGARRHRQPPDQAGGGTKAATSEPTAAKLGGASTAPSTTAEKAHSGGAEPQPPPPGGATDGASYGRGDRERGKQLEARTATISRQQKLGAADEAASESVAPGTSGALATAAAAATDANGKVRMDDADGRGVSVDRGVPMASSSSQERQQQQQSTMIKGRPTSGGSAKRREELLRKANSQGDLMSELSEKLSKRQQSVDDDGGGMQPTTMTEPGPSSVTAGRRARLERKSASSEDSAGGGSESGHLGNMKNRELLEKQSIFAITYSGLATDKLPGC